MSALTRFRLLVPMFAGFALAGPIVATASASDSSIVGVVNHWSPIVDKDEQKIVHAEQAYKKNRRAAPVVASLTHEVSDLRAFATALQSQAASSERGGEARDDIASGVRLIAGSYSKLASELRKAGREGLSQAQISANQRVVKAGHQKFVAGVKLLGKIA